MHCPHLQSPKRNQAYPFLLIHLFLLPISPIANRVTSSIVPDVIRCPLSISPALDAGFVRWFGLFSLTNTALTKFGNWFGGFLEGTGDRFDAVIDSTMSHSFNVY